MNRNPELDIFFWRTSSDQEVDFILGDRLAAIEIKSGNRVAAGDTRHIRALLEDGPVKHKIIVSRETHARKLDGGILVLPWREFLDRLWEGEME